MTFLLTGIVHGGEIKDACSTVSKDSEYAVLKVYYVHWMIETPVSLAPDQLAKSYSHHFESKDYAPHANAADLLLHVDGKVLKKARPEEIDCRWAFIVSDEAGHVKLAIYADGFLSEAVMNDTMFVPDKRFRSWVKTAFGQVFQLGRSIK